MTWTAFCTALRDVREGRPISRPDAVALEALKLMTTSTPPDPMRYVLTARGNVWLDRITKGARETDAALQRSALAWDRVLTDPKEEPER